MNENKKYETFIRERINSLRTSRNLSEYQLSLDLGHSQGYIQSISSGRILPSVSVLLDICDYFDITPLEFFDPELSNPTLFKQITTELKKLSENDLLFLLMILRRINQNSSISDDLLKSQYDYIVNLKSDS